MDLSANGQVFAVGVPVNTAGEFIVFLDTAVAEAGSYKIAAASGAISAHVTTFLGAQWPLKGLEGGGAIYSLPAGIGGEVIKEFLTLVRR